MIDFLAFLSCQNFLVTSSSYFSSFLTLSKIVLQSQYIYFCFIDDHCQYWLNETAGTLISPNYYFNLNCTWNINADQGFYINLDVTLDDHLVNNGTANGNDSEVIEKYMEFGWVIHQKKIKICLIKNSPNGNVIIEEKCFK